MLKIGLTGGIGSGKSTVAKVFETLGIPVYYADLATRRLLHTSPELKAAIIKQFGENSYRDGELDRAFIAGIVFSDPEKLKLLNALTHPATIADAEDWMQKQLTPYVIKEAALLFESGANKNLDFVIGVSAPESLRLERVAARDNTSVDEIRKRINNQLDEDEKMKRCDFIIHNDEHEMILPQILLLHKKLISLGEND
jgi:dephospho-CoA kinase